jgi:hypothetical protein
MKKRQKRADFTSFDLSPAELAMKGLDKDIVLTPEQEAEAQRLAEIFLQKAREETLAMARIMVSKPDRQLLGESEFQVRDSAHRLAAHAIETALNERKKRGTKDRA